VASAAVHLGDFIERLNVHAERDRLLDEFAAMDRRQRFLLDANQALSTTKGLDATIDRLARVAVPAIGDLCLIDVVTRDRDIERLIAYHADETLQLLAEELRQFPPQLDSDHPAAIAIRSGISKVGHDMPDQFLLSTTQGVRHYEVTRKLQFTSYVSAPLVSARPPIGALTLVSAGSGRHFGNEELCLLEELAAQVMSVLERERRFDEDHQVAHILQRSMLPEVKSRDGLDICVRYFSSGENTEVGGDFYDVVHVDFSRVALVVGDVQGHDLVAITALRLQYETAHCHLPVGAGITFYTDGLVETRSSGPDAKLSRLVNALDRHRRLPLEVACDAIIEETIAGVSHIDDVAVLWAARTREPTGMLDSSFSL
jgi:Stage II sporulation protein E (SpoIIE)/GAF domain